MQINSSDLDTPFISNYNAFDFYDPKFITYLKIMKNNIFFNDLLY